MRSRPSRRVVGALVATLAAASTIAGAATTPDAATLKRPEAFDSIADPRERSTQLFLELGRVLQSPRCMNCHPRNRVPTQGEDLHTHNPPIDAGAPGHGPVGLPCATCHQAANVDTRGASIAVIPGHPHWSLAPASMAWQHYSLAEICEQVKDPARNGGRTLAAIHEHLATDTLVGWAWHPGAGRVPAPGTQAEFGRLVQAWIATGAACPTK